MRYLLVLAHNSHHCSIPSDHSHGHHHCRPGSINNQAWIVWLMTICKNHKYKMRVTNTTSPKLTIAITKQLVCCCWLSVGQCLSETPVRRKFLQNDFTNKSIPECCTTFQSHPIHTQCRSHHSGWRGRCRDCQCLGLTLSHSCCRQWNYLENKEWMEHPKYT